MALSVEKDHTYYYQIQYIEINKTVSRSVPSYYYRQQFSIGAVSALLRNVGAAHRREKRRRR